MGETSVWGYVALAAAILGFAFGLWRQSRAKNKKANTPEEAKRAELLKKLDESEKDDQ